tara:strand:- start:1365 stop:1499 length:135 start_codon:yes stop_codon:yes gene_type:complete
LEKTDLKEQEKKLLKDKQVKHLYLGRDTILKILKNKKTRIQRNK